MSSYADPLNPVSLYLVSSSMHGDSGLKHMLATSLAVHAVLLFGLMSLRLVPTIQQPMALYHVDLVAMPDSQVIPSKQESKNVKKPLVSPPVPVVEKPVHAEQVERSIVSAVESVEVPQSRKMIPIEKSPLLPSRTKSPAGREVKNPSISMPVVPRAPKLSTLSTSSPKVSSTPTKSAPTGSMAETLKQAIKSVTVPRKVIKRQAPISVTVKPNEEPIVPSTSIRSTTSSKITMPGQVPQLAEVVSASNTKKAQTSQRIQSRVSDSLKQVMQSVVVSEVKKRPVPKSKYTPAISIPALSIREPKSIPRKKLGDIVMPMEALDLAKVDIGKARKGLMQKTPEIVPEPMELDSSQKTIAKLPIPEVKEIEAYHILSTPTEDSVKKPITALQVSGTSLKGSVYWGRVRSKIDRKWIAPTVDVRSDQPIHVLLAFRVERNGAVKNLSIKESSGNGYYDLAAKRAVINAAPLPAFSSDMPEPYYDIQFQFTVNQNSLS